MQRYFDIFLNLVSIPRRLFTPVSPSKGMCEYELIRNGIYSRKKVSKKQIRKETARNFFYCKCNVFSSFTFSSIELLCTQSRQFKLLLTHTYVTVGVTDDISVESQNFVSASIKTIHINLYNRYLHTPQTHFYTKNIC